MVRYGRKYSLILGKPEKVTRTQTNLPLDERILNTANPDNNYLNKNNPITIVKNLPSNFYARQYKEHIEKESYIELTDLQIVANVPQNKNENAMNSDKAYIEIYNLSDEDIDFIHNNVLYVFLRAGYRNDFSLDETDFPYVFTGEVQIGETRKSDDGVNTITRLTCGQSLRVGKDVRVQKTYPNNIGFNYIVEDLVLTAKRQGIVVARNDMDKVNRGIIPESAVSVTKDKPTGKDITTFTNRSVPVDGYLLDEISRISNMIGYRTYMVNNELIIENNYMTDYVSDNTIMGDWFVVEENMIQADIGLGSNINNQSGDSVKPELIVKLYLDGRCTVDKKMRINFGKYAGDYDIVNVEHLLDYEGSNWTTEVTITSRGSSTTK